MKDQLKKLARQIFIRLRLPITKNIGYDIYTEQFLKKHLHPNSNCVDVGAHKGEILDIFLQLSSKGSHFAFEPIPAMYSGLIEHYGNKLKIYPYALSGKEGRTTFNIVLDDPAYSGLKQRKYKTQNTRIEKIEVEMRKLDDVLKDRQVKIDMIKIDVEGGEFDVLKGAIELITKDHPMLIFEFGQGASEYYGTTPDDIYNLLNGAGYQLWTLPGICKNKTSLNLADFQKVYHESSDYYFVGRFKN